MSRAEGIDPRPSAVGVAAGELAVVISREAIEEAPFASLRHAQRRIPPALVLGELGGEHPTVDLRAPPHIRGAGLSWPPCARVRFDGTARFPLALAWPLLEHATDGLWLWGPKPDRRIMVNPADAIAQVVAAAVDAQSECSDDRSLTLVVPNTLVAEKQEDLLGALASRRLRAHLLWRPVAAALSWVERHGQHVLDDCSKDDEPIGSLWSIHLGIDAFEVTQLELIAKQDNGQRFLLPARRLASTPSLVAAGLYWVEHLASEAVLPSSDSANAAWNLLWTTNWLERLQDQLAQNEEPTTESEDFYSLHGTQAIERGKSAWAKLVRGPLSSILLADYNGARVSDCTRLRASFAPFLGPYDRPDLAYSVESTSILQWMDQVKKSCSSDLPVLGLVMTGSLAALRTAEKTVGQFVFEQTARRPMPPRTLLEDHSQPSGWILAQGASTFASKRARGLPTYLDMLPRIQTLIIRHGEPTWADLFAEEQRYVPGGDELYAKPSDLRVGVKKEASFLKLSVWREGHDTVREVKVPFPTPVAVDTPVALETKLTPGQGNPRVEVKADDSTAFSGRRVYLDWKRSEDSGRTRQQVLDDEPRTNPPHVPRLASRKSWEGGYWGPNYWEGARAIAARFLDNSSKLRLGSGRRRHAVLKPRLEEVRIALRHNDLDYVDRDIPEHATAVSSEGSLHPDATQKKLLSQLVTCVDELLAACQYDVVEDECLRILGYCSADSRHLQKVLRTALAWPATIRAAHLVAIGNCARQPAVIRGFSTALVTNLTKGKRSAPNNWMRAMCRILQYRPLAAEALDSDLCEEITKACFHYLRKQVDEGAAKYLYRHSSLCIVYLLRRRRWDDSYLDPKSPLARKIKSTFRTAIQRFEDEDLDAIGGFVDLPHVTRLMIDYINRKGKGRLTGDWD